MCWGFCRRLASRPRLAAANVTAHVALCRGQRPRPSPRAPVVNPRSSLYVRSYPAAASPTASNPDAHHSSDPHADTPAEPAHTKAHRHPQPGGAQRPRGAGAVRQDLQAETDQTRIHSGRAGPAFPGLSLLAGPSCRRVASKDQDVS